MSFRMSRVGESWEMVGRKPCEIVSSEKRRKGINGVGEKVGKNFRVNFKENFRVNFKVTGKPLERMTDRVMKLYTRNILIVEEISKEYGVSERTIHEDIGRLKQWSLVTFEGPPKTGTYVLTDKGRALVEAAG